MPDFSEMGAQKLRRKYPRIAESTLGGLQNHALSPAAVFGDVQRLVRVGEEFAAGGAVVGEDADTQAEARKDLGAF